MRVLIPLNSGHQSGRRRLRKRSQRVGLNPFEFRASVRTIDDREAMAVVRVLIPLNSGHQSGLLEESK